MPPAPAPRWGRRRARRRRAPVGRTRGRRRAAPCSAAAGSGSPAPRPRQGAGRGAASTRASCGDSPPSHGSRPNAAASTLPSTRATLPSGSVQAAPGGGGPSMSITSPRALLRTATVPLPSDPAAGAWLGLPATAGPGTPVLFGDMSPKTARDPFMVNGSAHASAHTRSGLRYRPRPRSCRARRRHGAEISRCAMPGAGVRARSPDRRADQSAPTSTAALAASSQRCGQSACSR